MWLEEITSLQNQKVDYVMENYEMLIKEIEKEISDTNKILIDEFNDIIQYINT